MSSLITPLIASTPHRHLLEDSTLALQLHLIREPRALVLTSETFCLVFRSKQPRSNDVVSGASLVVEFLPKDRVDLTRAVQLNGRVSGCLVVLRVANGQ